MADNNKEVVRVLKDVTEELHQLNRNIRVIAKVLEQKQFDDWVSPPIGTVYQNNRGCVMMSKFDFEKLVRNSDEEGEEK